MGLLSGKDFRIKAEDSGSPGTYVNVGGITTVADRRSSTTTHTDFFGSADGATTESGATWDITATGKFDDDDPGQVLLRAAREAGTPISIQILRDGTNGYSVDCRVSGGGSAADAGGALQDTDFTLSPDGTTKAIVGTGPI